MDLDSSPTSSPTVLPRPLVHHTPILPSQPTVSSTSLQTLPSSLYNSIKTPLPSKPSPASAPLRPPSFPKRSSFNRPSGDKARDGSGSGIWLWNSVGNNGAGENRLRINSSDEYESERDDEGENRGRRDKGKDKDSKSLLGTGAAGDNNNNPVKPISKRSSLDSRHFHSKPSRRRYSGTSSRPSPSRKHGKRSSSASRNPTYISSTLSRSPSNSQDFSEPSSSHHSNSSLASISSPIHSLSDSDDLDSDSTIDEYASYRRETVKIEGGREFLGNRESTKGKAKVKEEGWTGNGDSWEEVGRRVERFLRGKIEGGGGVFGVVKDSGSSNSQTGGAALSGSPTLPTTIIQTGTNGNNPSNIPPSSPGTQILIVPSPPSSRPSTPGSTSTFKQSKPTDSSSVISATQQISETQPIIDPASPSSAATSIQIQTVASPIFLRAKSPLNPTSNSLPNISLPNIAFPIPEISFPPLPNLSIPAIPSSLSNNFPSLGFGGLVVTNVADGGSGGEEGGGGRRGSDRIGERREKRVLTSGGKKKVREGGERRKDSGNLNNGGEKDGSGSLGEKGREKSKQGDQDNRITNGKELRKSSSISSSNEGSTLEPNPPPTLGSKLRNLRLHFTPSLLPSVLLIVLPLLVLRYRLLSSPIPPPLPLHILTPYICFIFLLSLFRLSPNSYLMVPFTDERGYRPKERTDDGAIFSFGMPVLLAGCVWWDTVDRMMNGEMDGKWDGTPSLEDVWDGWGWRNIYDGGMNNGTTIIGVRDWVNVGDKGKIEALLRGRGALCNLMFIDSLIHLFQIFLASTLLKVRFVPISNSRRWSLANLLSLGISILLSLVFNFVPTLKTYLNKVGVEPAEIGISSFVYQISHYMISRLVRRGFSLGELSIVCACGTMLAMEFWRITRARWFYPREHPMIPETFRSPTPIISFQHVLIPGTFVIGFCLSPLLVLSRHLAQQRSYRLRWPSEKERNRKIIALAVYVGVIFIVFCVLGVYESWVLGPKTSIVRPWSWILSWTFLGSTGVRNSIETLTGVRRWGKLFLVCYWSGSISVAIGWWQTRLAKARKITMKLNHNANLATGGISMGIGINGSGREGSHNKENGVNEGNSRLAVEPPNPSKDEKRMHVSVNSRRKFFHALAVILFVPGIAIDPAFSSIAFSIAFSIFTFAEYARYFALYPIGAGMHLFFTEFVDSKDCGPVILSHFFLLCGCAGPLWLEGSPGIRLYSGVLSLGVGDSMASIVGKKLGRIRWPYTSKSLEGTLSFIVSTYLTAYLMKLFGIVPYFSSQRYLIAATLTGLLEASSNQNDNIIIPIYMWALLTLLRV